MRDTKIHGGVTMFEKEAEEYATKHCCDSCKNLQARYRKVYKDGAEFGYNKANEWHYVKDGDLPSPKDDVLVLLEDGHYEISGVSTDNRWFCTDYYTGEDDVIAWKEIVLPKLN